MSPSPALSASSSVLRIQTAEIFEPLLGPGRYKGTHGGRGSGKSHFFAELMVERCLLATTRAVCVREVQKSLDQSVKKLIEDKISAFGVSSKFRILNTHIEGDNGSRIIFQGMQNHTADSIKSLEGYDIAWVEEAQNLSSRSLGLLRPTIRKDGSEMWFSWNPNQPSDPVEALLRRDPPPGTIVVEANYRQNPWFPDVLRVDMEYDKRRDPDRYAHVWLGGYQRHSEARVFRNWKIETAEVPEGARPFYGGDWGFANDPTVLIRLYFTDPTTIYIDREAYQVGCEIDRTPALFAGDDKRVPPRWENPDKLPGIPGAMEWPIVADSARPETISYMQRRGFNVAPARKGPGSLEEGIEFLKSYDVLVHPDCKHVIDELTLYAYKTDKLTEEILPVLEDKHNHTIDAIRYAVEKVRRADVFTAAETQFVLPSIKLPDAWARVAAIVAEGSKFGVVWAALNRVSDTFHVIDEYVGDGGQMAVHAEAIRKRGNWIPALYEFAEGKDRTESEHVAHHLADLGVDVYTVTMNEAAGVDAVANRLATGRLKVFEPMPQWLTEYRRYRRDEKGEIVREGDLLMRATAMIALHGADMAVSEADFQEMQRADPNDYVPAVSSTGY